eukprot:5266087-Prymnesium_polylepis.1
MAILLCIVAVFVVCASSQFGTIKIDWKQLGDSAQPVLDLGQPSESVAEELPEFFGLSRSIELAAAEAEAAEVAEIAAERTTEDTVTVRRGVIEDLLEQTALDKLRTLAARLGVPRKRLREEQLRQRVREVMAATKANILRSLLAERGAGCKGCTERSDYIEAVLRSLHRPQVARHSLPLFLYRGSHLYPGVTASFHFFEGRYKAMVRRALAADQTFGFVSTESAGSLAQIEEWRELDDGRFLVVVRGLQRFELGRQWDEDCADCTTGPLRVADVTFFSDTTPERRADALAAESTRHYRSLVGGSGVDMALEKQLGALPPPERGPYAISMWLAAACAAHPECAPLSEKLLLT